jgi:nitrous oxidase accessory protein NosD
MDGDASFLLLLVRVAVEPGESLDQRGLAMIDVTGSAKNQVLFQRVGVVLYAGIQGNLLRCLRCDAGLRLQRSSDGLSHGDNLFSGNRKYVKYDRTLALNTHNRTTALHERME